MSETNESHVFTQEQYDRVRAALAFYVPVLQLNDWRMLSDLSLDLDCSARAWRSNDYDTASILFNPTYDAENVATWRGHTSAEESVVHELIHLAIRDLCHFVSQSIIDYLPEPSNAMMRHHFESLEENFVERIALAMVAARHQGMADVGVSPAFNKMAAFSPEGSSEMKDEAP